MATRSAWDLHWSISTQIFRCSPSLWVISCLSRSTCGWDWPETVSWQLRLQTCPLMRIPCYSDRARSLCGCSGAQVLTCHHVCLAACRALSMSWTNAQALVALVIKSLQNHQVWAPSMTSWDVNGIRDLPRFRAGHACCIDADGRALQDIAPLTG